MEITTAMLLVSSVTNSQKDISRCMDLRLQMDTSTWDPVQQEMENCAKAWITQLKEEGLF
eukprot:7221527-Ditylum_brightwellii.AAC.1